MKKRKYRNIKCAWCKKEERLPSDHISSDFTLCTTCRTEMLEASWTITYSREDGKSKIPDNLKKAYGLK